MQDVRYFLSSIVLARFGHYSAPHACDHAISQKQIVICSKDFTEQVILVEILSRHIEAKT
ncbi:hypothetical protein [Kamptonema sp. PCC 6506]|uniref:hypothetical protein n=1 Tax=Kamptonema sp. PCC 6506 TaxID=272129 RepID=UPI0001DAD524|nr:hypothetical protein [Kamptonema sp. PCC 6506]CBN58350.1 hypothetical protein OSCI_3730007 [Kamptonema sp. PCC 6506]